MSLIARVNLVRHRNTIFRNNGQRLDLLNPLRTKSELIALLAEVIITKNHPFVFTAVRSDHHDDSGLGTHSHANGDAVDGWFLRTPKDGDYLDATSTGFLAALRDCARSPWLFSIGLGGSAWNDAARAAAGGTVFEDDGEDHIHLAARF